MNNPEDNVEKVGTLLSLNFDVTRIELNGLSVVWEANEVKSDNKPVDSVEVDRIVGVPVSERVEESWDVNKDSLSEEAPRELKSCVEEGSTDGKFAEELAMTLCEDESDGSKLLEKVDA